jgi:hypothetical protein
MTIEADPPPGKKDESEPQTLAEKMADALGIRGKGWAPQKSRHETVEDLRQELLKEYGLIDDD